MLSKRYKSTLFWILWRMSIYIIQYRDDTIHKSYFLLIHKLNTKLNTSHCFPRDLIPTTVVCVQEALTSPHHFGLAYFLIVQTTCISKSRIHNVFLILKFKFFNHKLILLFDLQKILAMIFWYSERWYKEMLSSAHISCRLWEWCLGCTPRSVWSCKKRTLENEL